jgi:uncharacterized protein YlaN (UPF0358 family)
MEHSEYFFRCLNNNWREVSKQEVVLGCDMASWCIFRNWLESGTATSKPPAIQGMFTYGFDNSMSISGSKVYTSLGPSKYIISINRLIHAWILGDYLVSPHFQNDVIDELTCAYENYWQYTKAIPSLLHMRDICENTLPNSPLRQVVLDLILFGLSKRLITFDKEVSSFVKDYLFFIPPEVSNGVDKGLGVRRPAPWNRWRRFYYIYPRGCR